MRRSSRRFRLAGVVLGTALVASACTVTIGSPTVGGTPPPPTASSVPALRPVAAILAGRGSAAATMRRLCVPPASNAAKPAHAGATPPAIAQTEQEVEAVRGLRYEHPVAVQPLSAAQLDAKVLAAFNGSYPASFYARRTLAWRALGVIPPDADIRRALRLFQTGEIVGFYDPDTGRLVYQGDAQLQDLDQRFTLAHELTHAIDDQHFDLSRLDVLGARCLDERSQAALGAVEGSAQYFAAQVITRFPGGTAASPAPGPPAGVPPFIVGMQLWPYTAGETFIATLRARGGIAAVNGALEHLPVSTAQVIHPDRYPSAVPVALNIPQLAGRLGPGWRDLDVMQVGEEFLSQMLQLRLPLSTATAATDAWTGGLYRAWTDGTHTAVLLATAWASPADAQAFAQAMQDWLAAGSTPGRVLADDGGRVVVGFSDDPAALAAFTGG